ncbi:hypothetical protein B5X24_HaOG208314 [Helicoverpa armigera]|nr:hypothetical protein B5X24_HaOG208314 [Helicoverpa armigera]
MRQVRLEKTQQERQKFNKEGTAFKLENKAAKFSQTHYLEFENSNNDSTIENTDTIDKSLILLLTIITMTQITKANHTKLNSKARTLKSVIARLKTLDTLKTVKTVKDAFDLLN